MIRGMVSDASDPRAEPGTRPARLNNYNRIKKDNGWVRTTRKEIKLFAIFYYKNIL
jgi:hypothetical protein